MVSGSIGRRTVRTVEQAHGLKISLAGPPTPFGRFGFFLGELGGMTDLAKVNAQRERLLAQLRTVRERLDAGVAAQSGDAKEKLLDLLDDIPTVDNAVEHTPTLPLAGAGAMFYGMIPDGAVLDCSALDLARHVESVANKADGPVASMPGATVAELTTIVKPVAKSIEDGLWAIWANQEAFKILTPSAPEGYPFFRGSLAKLTPEYFARRAHHRIVEPGSTLTGRVAANPGAELAKMLAAPLDGVVHVVTAKPITLTGKISGRVMLVFEKAPVKLVDVQLTDPAHDRLTVVSFGGAVGITGSSHAYVIAGPGTPVTIDKGATLTGGLVLAELAAGTRLEGSIVKSDAYDTGGFGAEPDPAATHTAVLSPLVLYRRVTR